MDVFNKELSLLLNEYQTTINNNIKMKTEPKISHNHLPVRFLVEDCECCIKYGNCFQKNIS